MKSIRRHLRDYVLKRYDGQDGGNLMAWDRADQLISEHLQSLPGRDGRLLLLNEMFGALTLALHYRQPISVVDSHLCRTAIQQNAQNNGVEPGSFTVVRELAEAPAGVQDVVIKLPKNHNLLTEQLSILATRYGQGVRVTFGGMNKYITRSVYDVLEHSLASVEVHRAVGKARLVTGKLKAPSGGSATRQKEYTIPGTKLTVSTSPSVFASTGLDPGSAVMLKHLPIHGHSSVCDLGCGAGPLGLVYASLVKTSSVDFVDDSFAAVRMAEANWLANGLDESRARFISNDCLTGCMNERYDLILCNPPFHRGHAIETGTAQRMFRDAHRCLVTDGELYVVFNRHLSYLRPLRRLFGSVDTLSKHPRFVVVRCIKGR
ncbi:MAG: methyltransferase [Bradymonadia bacterium]